MHLGNMNHHHYPLNTDELTTQTLNTHKPPQLTQYTWITTITHLIYITYEHYTLNTDESHTESTQ